MSNPFDEWEKDFVEKLMHQHGEWYSSNLTVGENRALLKTMLEMGDDQEICNFVVIAQVHDNNAHCIRSEHRGVIISSLDDDIDVKSFVKYTMEQL